MISFMIDPTPALELDIPHADRCWYYTWKGKVFFSMNARGENLEIHIAAKGRNKLYLREAAFFFLRYLESTFPRYKAINAIVTSKSVANLCKKCGLKLTRHIENICEVYTYEPLSFIGH